MEINELFSLNLARLRKAKGLSQRALAEKTGLTQRTVNYYEHAPKAIPVEKFKVLAKALSVKISDLFSEDSSDTLETIDVRWIKKIQDLQELSNADRKEINQHINSLLEKARLKKERVS